MNRWWCALAVVVGVWAWSQEVAAQSADQVGQPVTIAWDANSESTVLGYLVYVGTSSQVYTQTYDAGPSTSFNFATGIAGQTYYFAIAAYVTGPVMGPLSAEVSTTIAASSPQQSPPPDPTPPPGDTPPPVPVAMTSNGGSCHALPAPGGRVITVTPVQASLLKSYLSAAQPGDTIQFTDGQYALKETLPVTVPRLTLRSQSGNRGGVVLDGLFQLDDLITISASDAVIADLTLTRSRGRGIRVLPSTGNVYGTILHNIRIADALGASVQVGPSAGFVADNGVVECSSFELSDSARTAMQTRCDIGGISADAAANWQIDVNAFSGFWCASGSAGAAVRFGAGSRGTVVDRSVVVNSARGIVLGMSAGIPDRTYADQPCSGKSPVGHYGGTVLDNTVAANDARIFTSGDGFQSGIALEQSCGTNVLHNTVASTQAPRIASIDWRLPNTVATIANNLVSHTLAARDGATATTGGNVGNAPLTYFTDAAGGGNLHLTASAIGAIDTAGALSTPVGWDLDGASRSALPDVGADEYSGTRFTVSAPAQVTALQTLSVTWSADAAAATSSDWIGLYAAGSSDAASLDKKFTGGLASGTLAFIAPSAAGSYELRYFNGSQQLRVATSAAIAVTSATTPPPNTGSFIVTGPSQATPGQTLTAAWSGDATKITPSDAIGLYVVGAADASPILKKNTGGLTTGAMSFAGPSTAGSYEFRYFNSNLQIRMATSAPIVVSTSSTPPPPPSTTSFTISGPSQANVGQALAATWSGDATKITPSDAIGLYVVGAADASPLAKMSTGSLTTGTLSFAGPTVAGSYEFRYFNSNLQIRMATSGTISVTAATTTPPPPSTSSFTVAGPSQASVGQSLTATWSGDATKITPSDTIGLYVVGAADASPIQKQNTGGQTKGALSFTGPSAAGSYEFRYFNSNLQVRVAASGAIAVTASTTTPPPPGTTSFSVSGPSQASVGQVLTATWSGDATKITPSDTIGLYVVGAADASPIVKMSTGSLTTGTLSFAGPTTAGSYEFRYFNSNLQVRMATSAAITVTSQTAPPPSLTGFTLIAPTQANVGQFIVVTWSGDPYKITPSDTIGLFLAGAPDSAPVSKKLVGGLTNGSLPFIAPAAGTYEFRYLNSNLQTRVATSAPIAVTP